MADVQEVICRWTARLLADAADGGAKRAVFGGLAVAFWGAIWPVWPCKTAHSALQYLSFCSAERAVLRLGGVVAALLRGAGGLAESILLFSGGAFYGI